MSDVLTAVSTSVVWLTGFTDFFLLIFIYIYIYLFISFCVHFAFSWAIITVNISSSVAVVSFSSFLLFSICMETPPHLLVDFGGLLLLSYCRERLFFLLFISPFFFLRFSSSFLMFRICSTIFECISGLCLLCLNFVCFLTILFLNRASLCSECFLLWVFVLFCFYPCPSSGHVSLLLFFTFCRSSS